MIEAFIQKVLPEGAKGIGYASNLDITGEEGEDQMK